MNGTTVLLLVPLLGACIWLGITLVPELWNPSKDQPAQKDIAPQALQSLAANRLPSGLNQQRYKPRKNFDSSGSDSLNRGLKPWKDPTSLDAIREASLNLGHRNIVQADAFLAGRLLLDAKVFQDKFQAHIFKATMFMYEGEPKKAYEVLQEARKQVESSPQLAKEWLYSVIFFQGVAGLREGENDNCLQCRGEGACIFPIRPTAVHTNPTGSRLAIQHFTEYLEQFPDDLGVRWLLNLAYMTLGEYPHGVPAQYLTDL